ncbi:MAG TPA: SCO family protein [Burkholderiaceae bacterium]|nr:SCO family protein [Burkholderiaceae bacterium]
MRIRRAAGAALLAASLSTGMLLAGCEQQKPGFTAVDITGATYARDFSLVDGSGATRTLADYRGKVVAVFFGYTHCPDVCPTTMADLAQVRQKLGNLGGGLQVIFVTLDPERDTAPMLASYVPKFDPSFIALRGDPDQIARTAKEFKVFYQKVAGDSPDSYTLDHTAGTYVFDREGRIRLFMKYGEPAADVEADLRRLLT